MFHLSMPSKKKSGTASPDTSSPRLGAAQLDPSTGVTSRNPQNTSNSMPPPTSTNRLHSLGRAKSRGEPSSASTSRTNSPSPADDPALANHQPKRTSSFKSLGLSSFGSGLTRAAGEVVHGIGKSKDRDKDKSEATASVPSTPPVIGGSFNFNPAANGVTTSPDPSHLADFSLSLSELVNKAFAPCSAGSSVAASGSGILPTATSSVAGVGTATAAKSKKKQVAPPLSSIQFEGRRLPERSKVVEISELITKELLYAASVDPYLLRAVSRQALKALTLFANRMDTLLVPISRDSGAIKIPSNAKEGSHLPPALEFNIGLVTLEWIVEDSLERCLDGRMETDLGMDPGMPAFVSEILTPVRQKMERTILHVIQPLLTGVKSSLTTCLNQSVVEPFAPNLSSNSSGALGSISPHRSPEALSPTIPPTALNGHTSPPTAKDTGGSTSLLSRSDHSISHSSPAWLKELEARLEGARALLVPRIEERCGQDGEGWFISVVIHLIWKGLVILSSRSSEPFGSKSYDCSLLEYGTVVTPAAAPEKSHRGFGLSSHSSSSRAPSPAQLSSAIKAVSLTGGSNSKLPKKAGQAGGPSLPPSGRSTPVERSPWPFSSNQAATSPSRISPSRSTSQQISELQTFEKLVCRFARGFIPASSVPGSIRGRLGNPLNNKNSSSGLMVDGDESDSDSSDDEEDELARAALAEAIQAVRSTILVLQHIDTTPTSALNALCRSRGCPSSLSTCEGIPTSVGVVTSVSGSTSPAPASTSNLPASTNGNANATVPAEVLRAFKAVPALILLHLVYARLPRSSGPPSSSVSSSSEEESTNHAHGIQIPSPPALFGYTWQEYEKAIAGFNGGQTWAGALVNGWKESQQTEWQSLLEKEKKFRAREEAREKERKEAFNDHPPSRRGREENLPLSNIGLESEVLTPAPMLRSMSVASSDSEASLPEAMTRSAPTLDRARTDSEEPISETTPEVEGRRSTLSSPEISPPSTSDGRMLVSSGSARESLGAARDALLQRQALTSNATSGVGVPEGHQAPSRSNTGESSDHVSDTAPSPLPSPSMGGTTGKPRFWRSSSSQRTFHLPSLGRNASRGRGSEAEPSQSDEFAQSPWTEAGNPFAFESGYGIGNENQTSLVLGASGEWVQMNQEDRRLLKERENLNLQRFGLILFRKCLGAVAQTTGAV